MIFSEDGQAFQVYLGHIVFHSVCIGLNGHKPVCTTKKQCARPFVLIESAIAEFSNGQSVFPVVGLPGIGLGIESYQSLIGADPEIILLVFQNAMYGVVQKKVSSVMMVRIILVEMKQPRTGSQPIPLFILVNGKNIIGCLTVHYVIETIWG